jgi:hypothetical protein
MWSSVRWLIWSSQDNSLVTIISRSPNGMVMVQVICTTDYRSNSFFPSCSTLDFSHASSEKGLELEPSKWSTLLTTRPSRYFNDYLILLGLWLNQSMVWKIYYFTAWVARVLPVTCQGRSGWVLRLPRPPQLPVLVKTLQPWGHFRIVVLTSKECIKMDMLSPWVLIMLPRLSQDRGVYQVTC